MNQKQKDQLRLAALLIHEAESIIKDVKSEEQKSINDLKINKAVDLNRTSEEVIAALEDAEYSLKDVTSNLSTTLVEDFICIIGVRNVFYN